jgi:hypothetical protein
MALQEEIELGRVNYVTIYDCAGGTISTPIHICDVGRRGEANVRSFSNNNDGNLRAYPHFFARR